MHNRIDDIIEEISSIEHQLDSYRYMLAEDLDQWEALYEDRLICRLESLVTELKILEKSTHSLTRK